MSRVDYKVSINSSNCLYSEYKANEETKNYSSEDAAQNKLTLINIPKLIRNKDAQYIRVLALKSIAPKFELQKDQANEMLVSNEESKDVEYFEKLKIDETWDLTIKNRNQMFSTIH